MSMVMTRGARGEAERGTRATHVMRGRSQHVVWRCLQCDQETDGSENGLVASVVRSNGSSDQWLLLRR